MLISTDNSSEKNRVRRFKLHSWRLLILIDEKQVNKTSKGYYLRSQIKTSKYSGKSPFAFAMLLYAEGEGNAWVFQEFLARIVRGVKGHLERFPFNPKFWNLRLVHTSGHFGRQDRNGPTLGTRGFFLASDLRFVGRFRNRKPRMKGLWHPG